jgi:hypothetical protein
LIREKVVSTAAKDLPHPSHENLCGIAITPEKQNSEFFSADTSANSSMSGNLRQDPSKARNNLITSTMTIQIIDLLEMIEVA